MEQQGQRRARVLRLLRRLFLLGVILFVLYTAFGFFIAPLLLKHFVVKGFSDTFHRQVSIQKITVNPLKLTYRMRGLSVEDHGGPLFSLDQVYVHLKRPSFLPLGLVIEEVEVERFHIRVVRKKDGTFNCSDLLETKAADKEKGSKPLGFSIRNIKVSGGVIDFLDEAKKVNHHIKDITFAVPFLSSFPDDAQNTIEPDFRAALNGKAVSLRGQTRPFLESLETTLNLNVENLDLTPFLPYVPFEMNCKIVHGLASLKAQISYAKDKARGDRLFASGDLSLHSLEAHEQNGNPLVKLPRVAISLARSDLMKKGIHLSKVALESPEFHIRRGSDGSINLPGLVSPQETGPGVPGKKESAKDAFSIRVDEIKVVEGRISFSDNLAGGVFETALEKVNLAIHHFSNEKAQRPSLELSLQTEAGEAASAKGSFSLDPLFSEGEISFKGIPLTKYSPYYREKLLFNIDGGHADLSSKFIFLKGDGEGAEELKLSDVSVSLSGLSLKKADEKEAFLSIPNSLVKETSVDVLGKKIVIGSLLTEKGTLRISRSAKGVLSVSELLPAPGPKNGEGQAPQGGEKDEALWSVALTKGVVDDFAIGFEDRAAPTSPVTVAFNQIKLVLEDFSNAKGNQAKMSLDLNVPTKGKLAAKGSIGISPLLANLNMDLKDLDIKPYEPYWDDKLRVSVTDGKLSLSGNLALRDTEREGINAHFKGEASLSSFASNDKRDGEDFFNAKSLYLGGVNLSYNPTQVSIDKVALTDFYSRLSIDQNGVVNIQDLIEKPEGVAREVAEKTDRKEVKTPPMEQGTPRIDVKAMTLQGGEINFSDRYIKPNFSALLTEIGGRISDLSSAETVPADVHLSGKLNHHAPLEITGKINPLRKDIVLDLELKFKDIDMGPMTPYAGKYIGYTIEKGKLSLELKYLIVEKKLESQNKIFLDQFTLGNTIDSPYATKLPVALAVSLLKNRKGEIELNMPVSGNLDDPEFNVGSLILKMFMNLLEKVFTSPFSLLGSLFGGGEKLSYLEFPPGVSDVPAEGEENLNKLIRIMHDRPGLKLELEGHVDVKSDEEALRKIRFMRKLKAQKLKDMLSKGEPNVPLEAVEIQPDEREKYLKLAFKKEDFPKPRGEWLGIKDLPSDEMEKLIFNHIQVKEDDLRLLANERAEKVRGHILKSGEVETERLLLVEPKSLAPEKEEKLRDSRVNFRLK